MSTETEPQSSLADQIRARVHAADQERIAKRADAAAAVAGKLHERNDLARRMVAIDKELAALVAAATADLMTEKELADFIGVRPTELPLKASRRSPRSRRVTADQ